MYGVAVMFSLKLAIITTPTQALHFYFQELKSRNFQEHKAETAHQLLGLVAGI